MGVERVDLYLLHGPTGSAGLTPDDWAAWRAMEAILDSGRAQMLGVSNFKLEQLQCLWQEARVCPRFVQNRCYAILGWDRRVREFCQANGMAYQGFHLGMTSLSGMEERPLAPLWHRAVGLLFRHGDHFHNFAGLRQYQEMFDPVWHPKYRARRAAGHCRTFRRTLQVRSTAGD